MDVPKRRSSASSSPEFEFWPVSANPAASPSSADELFADGVLLPLDLLPKLPPEPEPTQDPQPHPHPNPPPGAEPDTSGAAITTPATSGSKRWKDIFKPGDKKTADEKEKRKCKPTTGAGASAGSELNINIWPFSRSRSAGGGGGSAKPKPPPGPRKSSSAPCSRSNSRGEAGSQPRRWAASPGRAGAGVPVGRSSPVWQIKRTAKPNPTQTQAQAQAEPASGSVTDKRAHTDRVTSAKRSGSGVRGINLSVNSCIGYRHQVSCRRVETGGVRSAGESGGGLFGFKGFFSKKVH